MSRSHEAVVAGQYQDRAALYIASSVHAGGADVDQVSAWAAAWPGARALDVSCGGGHVSYRLARHAETVWRWI